MNQPQTTSQSGRVDATPEAIALVERLCAKFGPIMFHQAGKGHDDASPMCYPEDEFFLGHCDVCIGAVGGVPFYMSEAQFAFWKDRRLTIDVGPGRGGPFSLENGLGLRFILRSRPFSDEERAALKPVKIGCPDGGPAEHAR